MSYTREQRAANAAKAAETASRAAVAAGMGGGDPSPEPQDVEPGATEPKSEQPQERKIVRGNQTRVASLDEIEQRQARTEPSTPAPEAKTEPAPTPETKPATPGTPEPLPMAEPVKMAKVKVDGDEFEVPQADVDEAGGIRPYQTQRAADNRLKKANDTLAEVRRMQSESKPAIPAAPIVTDDAFIQSKVDVIRFGTPEESAAALREVIARTNPRIDENLFLIKANANLNHDAAKAKFQADYPDVITNPLLSRLVPQLAQDGLSAYVKNGQPDWTQLGTLDWNKFYASIGNQIRSAVPRSSQPQPAAAAPGATTPIQPDKEARKASIVNLPSAAARAALPEEAKPESREDILEGMRKARRIPTG